MQGSPSAKQNTSEALRQRAINVCQPVDFTLMFVEQWLLVSSINNWLIFLNQVVFKEFLAQLNTSGRLRLGAIS